MTRTATKPSRAKRPLDATPWNELKSGMALPKKTKTENAEKEKKAPDTSDQNKLKKKKIVKPEMKEAVRLRKKESRRLKRKYVRETEKKCFGCRKTGHVLSECPSQNTDSTGTFICFKCGSTEHMSRHCKNKSGSYSFATCFICKKSGHISRDCPQNDNGVYPNGGCCLNCGSNKHLRRDCPKQRVREGIPNMKLSTSATGSADMETAVEVDETSDGETSTTNRSKQFKHKPNKKFSHKNKHMKRKVVKF